MILLGQAELTARIDGHILKIALVYSVILGENHITGRALAIAIEIGKWLQASTLNVFSSIGLDAIGKAEQDILQIVEKRPWIYRRDLQRPLHGVSGEVFARALRSLDANGFIVCHDGKIDTPFGAFVGGHARPWVEYVRADR